MTYCCKGMKQEVERCRSLVIFGLKKDHICVKMRSCQEGNKIIDKENAVLEIKLMMRMDKYILKGGRNIKVTFKMSITVWLC